ncbi:hypothetical protein S40288_11536 [Stachybotrys chartarum IBT 40288]|nr:hypothetical protein S40288_11536 [Stachybotrys chartarum IBT 40288]
MTESRPDVLTFGVSSAFPSRVGSERGCELASARRRDGVAGVGPCTRTAQVAEPVGTETGVPRLVSSMLTGSYHRPFTAMQNNVSNRIHGCMRHRPATDKAALALNKVYGTQRARRFRHKEARNGSANGAEPSCLRRGGRVWALRGPRHPLGFLALVDKRAGA